VETPGESVLKNASSSDKARYLERKALSTLCCTLKDVAYEIRESPNLLILRRRVHEPNESVVGRLISEHGKRGMPSLSLA